MGSIAVSFLLGLLRAFFTRKVIFNLIVVLADWAAKRTDNDLDNNLLEAVKGGLDYKDGEWAGNLYDAVLSRG